MRSLSSLIGLILLLATPIFSQSPHGDNLKVNCAVCHTPNGWEVQLETVHYNHDSTRFPLTGQHQQLDCRQCHSSLIFNEIKSDCNFCHQDMHQLSVGLECARCHTTSSWIVDDIKEVHFENGFPLTGAHATAECKQCHKSANSLKFDRLGSECIGCHLTDFETADNPNHKGAGFSTNCIECHNPNQRGWKSTSINHDFFPLNQGHDIQDCRKCHTDPVYSNTPTDCASCHNADYNKTQNPNHKAANISTLCSDCHTTQIGWEPAKFLDHDDAYFKIYSGKHKGVWKACVECHTNPANFADFSCIVCHKKMETDNDHKKVNGYFYDDQACLACHPSGNKEDVFDHNATAFPLTGSHIDVNCIECHKNGFKGTPTQCSDCHLSDFTQTLNPNHTKTGFSKDCASCHTTVPDWKPATLANHSDYYPLNGAHAKIVNDCASCHKGNYNQTPNTCAGCHIDDYNQTVDPSHKQLQFSNDCASCHSETAWIPSTFDHDAVHFPIYSGTHKGEWNQCTDCHVNLSNYKEFSCIVCHTNPKTNDDHTLVNGYFYSNDACFACHPMGRKDDAFDHNSTSFPLTGAHTSVQCKECHAGGFKGTSTQCMDCHTKDYNSSINPPHSSLAIPKDCALCHTTAPDWKPAGMPIHDQYYPLTGAHATIANDCAVCHRGDYTQTPKTCAGCHTQDYVATLNPNHTKLGMYSDCAICHTTNPDWKPAGMPNHSDFYVLKGAHAGIANECATCHKGDYINTPNTCAGCHQTDYNNTKNPPHKTLQFSTDCATCHTETTWSPATFDHDAAHFPIYSGTHKGEWNQCTDCHTNPTNYKEFSCTVCHTNPKADEDHKGVPGYTFQSTACLVCHPTGEANSGFDHNTTQFPLTGAHTTVACKECHSNGYKGTTMVCNDCHKIQFQQAKNPNHQSLGFPTECASCHTTAPGWKPATFGIHDTYYPLTGAHQLIANDCAACHKGNYNTTPNTCDGCHIKDFQASKNPDHTALGFPTECASCHTTVPDWKPASFGIHDNYYPLTGAHQMIANDCAKCHKGNYNNTPNTCEGCHMNDYNGSTNPNHGALGIPTDCATCHTTAPDWKPASFGIHDNYYPLTGAHQLIANDCAKCHQGNYNNTPNTCEACHMTDFNATKNPNHGALGIPTDCATCHTTAPDWKPASFGIHDNYYPLTGAHQMIANDCAKCHKGNYNTTPNTCEACHMADYNRAANPNHIALGFPTDCGTCHTTAPNWKPATFAIHDNYYPLTGAHLLIASDCAACHKGNYKNTPNTCEGCHIKDYNSSTNPNHKVLGLSTDCASCHTTVPDWKPATFAIHDIYYPFTGAHLLIATDCAACHKGNYNNTPKTCEGCHLTDYNTSKNPNHPALGIPTDCIMCHTTAPDWKPASFDIHNNFYPFTGAHIPISNDCAACHKGNYNNTPNTCEGCHMPDYNSSTNPNHNAIGIPTDCDMCHTTVPDWEPASFPIHNQYWPIEGAHLQIANDCAICHNGNYNNTPNTCEACHMADYNGTTNPNHNAIGIPTDCDMCHTANPGWMPATFPIHNQFWQLKGAHALIANDCDACHNGNYNNTPNTCYGCHQSDYNGTTNPNHVSAQFPTDCELCHNETAWIPSTFNHDGMYFPIYSGKHKDEWNQCVDCHTSPGNYSVFACITCHEHNKKSEVDKDHKNVTGYSYNSNACYSCHPQGKK
ncbi:MAG: hypothetical protein WBO31_12800 [Saprospiraceae bacterium]